MKLCHILSNELPWLNTPSCTSHCKALFIKLGTWCYMKWIKTRDIAPVR